MYYIYMGRRKPQHERELKMQTIYLVQQCEDGDDVIVVKAFTSLATANQFIAEQTEEGFYITPVALNN